MKKDDAYNALQYLRTVDIDLAVGGAIEDYFETFPVSDDVVPVFERFLSSRLIGNRDAALAGLIVYGQRDGYEADALLLHYQSRSDGSAEEYAAIDYLRRLRDRGSTTADRVLRLLDSEPYVASLWS